jgi:hypothetical protein
MWKTALEDFGEQVGAYHYDGWSFMAVLESTRPCLREISLNRRYHAKECEQK